MLLKNVDKKENNSVAFQVETDKNEFEEAVGAAYKKNKAQIYIPGFRKGKAPRTVIEGMYGAEVFYQDALDILAPDAFDFGVKESGLRLVGTPAISDYKVTDDRTAEFTFVSDVYPEVTLGEYKGLKATRPAVAVSDEEVKAELESVQRRNGRKISVEREAAMGDTANIDFDGFLNGERFEGGKAEGYFLELGSNSFVPGFEEQIVGMSIGEEKDINITFPEDYVENLAGKDVVFKVKLNGLTYTELPALDDEFAKDISEFDTLDEYTADLRKTLEQKHKDSNENAIKSELMQQAAANITVTIPESMIQMKEEEIVRNYAANFGVADDKISFQQLCQMIGLDKETMDTSIRPTAESQVRSELLLEAVAEAENFDIGEADVNEYVERIAANMGATPDQLKSYFGEEFIKSELKKEKAASVIFDSAVIADQKKTTKKTAKKTAEAAPAEAAAEETEEKKPAKAKKPAKKAETEEPAAEEPAKPKKTTKKTVKKEEAAEAPAAEEKTEKKAPAKKKTAKKVEE